MWRRTPLAWKNLTYDPRRLAIAVGGVGFAVLLMFVELGFLNALVDSTVQVLVLMRGELILVSAAKYAMPAPERFDIRRLYQAQAVAGVTAAHPVYMETLGAVLRARDPVVRHKGYPIRAFAFRAADGVLDIPGAAALASQLAQPGVALIDSCTRPQYCIPLRLDELLRCDAELSGRRIRFAGTFQLGVDFATEGNLLMEPANFAEYFPFRAPGADPLDIVDVGVVQVAAGENVARVQARLVECLPDDVAVFTKTEFIGREKTFWRKSTPVGYIFTVGVVVGFLVGVIVCYQIIYADITDHIPEFATLKAMGYRDRYFIGLVLTQSSYLSVLGFVPGCLVSVGMYRLLAGVTGLTMQLKGTTTAAVFAATLLMCAISGLLAVRRLAAADPAELY